MFGRAPRTTFSALTTVTGGEWNVDIMDADSLRAKVRQVVDEQERFCKDVQASVAVSRETKRKIAQGKAVLPKFAVGDFVLYARVRKQGVTPKFMSTWTGPWRVVGADLFSRVLCAEHCFWQSAHRPCRTSPFLC